MDSFPLPSVETPAPSPPEESPPLAALREYPKLAAAREASLALAARSWNYRIERSGRTWTLLVEEAAREAALEELAQVEAEQREAPAPLPARDFGEFSAGSLLVTSALLLGIFLLQDRYPILLPAGDADGAAILRGQWWRCLTALTLHADGGHIGANLAIGTLFAGFLIPQLGAGFTWLLVLVSGGLGNLINSWGYRGEDHHSIGASTAVFAALGLLVASEAFHRWRDRARSYRPLLVPLGGGLALLAFLGVGDKHESIDFMAHWWGFVSGLVLGWPAAAWAPRERVPALWRTLAGWLALALLVVAWVAALRAAG